MLQLILHLIGDYVTQSDWMAQNKTKRSWPALCHAVVYSVPFLFIGSWAAFAVILSTHFFIDRFRLARFVVYLKNRLLCPEEGPHYADAFIQEVIGEGVCLKTDENLKAGKAWEAKWKWSNCSTTGYPSESPAWLSVWLLIAADNTLHLAINYWALTYL